MNILILNFINYFIFKLYKKQYKNDKKEILDMFQKVYQSIENRKTLAFKEKMILAIFRAFPYGVSYMVNCFRWAKGVCWGVDAVKWKKLGTTAKNRIYIYVFFLPMCWCFIGTIANFYNIGGSIFGFANQRSVILTVMFFMAVLLIYFLRFTVLRGHFADFIIDILQNAAPFIDIF